MTDKIYDPETTPIEILIKDIGDRCHEGMTLMGGYTGDWEASVCSTSSRQENADPNDKDAYWSGPTHKTPEDAIRALYRVYVINGLKAC